MSCRKQQLQTRNEIAFAIEAKTTSKNYQLTNNDEFGMIVKSLRTTRTLKIEQ